MASCMRGDDPAADKKEFLPAPLAHYCCGCALKVGWSKVRVASRKVEHFVEFKSCMQSNCCGAELLISRFGSVHVCGVNAKARMQFH